MRGAVIQVAYVGASILFILGLRSLTRPDRARRGMQLAAAGMLLAITGTSLNHQILDYKWIVLGVIVGMLLGYPLGMWMPMTAMPQRLALALTLSSLATTLVGVAAYHTGLHSIDGIGHTKASALGLEVLLGSMTVGGTLAAAGKLRELITSRPLTYKGQHLASGALFAFILGLFAFLVMQPQSPAVFYAIIGLAFLFGVMFVLPIGRADMPVVVALLNSCSGLAACAAGFAIDNVVLIITGALVGASGFMLSVLMGKTMHRTFSDVLFLAFGSLTTNAAARQGDVSRVRAIDAEDAAIQLARARRVIIVPGYGMAVAQAQNQVRELADVLERRGSGVKYAIHPAAGRMPGHMRMLLDEANVPGDKMYDMEEINGEFERADVVLVIGANDIVNPAARADASSPIFGVPILDAHRARSVIVLKRSLAAGFAGIENGLFHDPKTSMLFGDAKASLSGIIWKMKSA